MADKNTIAKVMKEKSFYDVTPDIIVPLKIQNKLDLNVYAAQVGVTTVLALEANGKFEITIVHWFELLR